MVLLQVCVPGPLHWCLMPPCEPWGECRLLSDEGQHVAPRINPGPRDCIPNHASLNNGCARLTLILDRARLPHGSRVQMVCQGLRAAWADRHAHTSTPAPIILCGLLVGTNDTIEVTLVSIQSFVSPKHSVDQCYLGMLVNRSLECVAHPLSLPCLAL